MKNASARIFVVMMGLGLAGCGDNGASGTSDETKPTREFLARFDPQKGESPEGLALSPDGKTAYAGLINTGRILAVSIPGGEIRAFGSVPPAPAEGLSVLGLATDEAGNVYVAAGSDSPAYPSGIYKIAPQGGVGALFAAHPDMAHPNGIAFSPSGEMMISDSIAGVLFKSSADGKTVTPWLSHPLLQGDPMGPCGSGLPFPIGVNGVAFANGSVYVTNSDKATLLRIPIGPDGAAGAPAPIVEPDASCLPLAGPEGIVADEDGSILVATYARSQAIIRVKVDGTTETVVAGDPLDVPTNLAFVNMDDERRLVVANCACGSPDPAPNPGPGLVWYGPLP